MRILGLPVQFVAVVSISLALTIYFGAWAADMRMDGRASQASVEEVQGFDFSSAGSASFSSGLAGGLGQRGSESSSEYGNATEGQAWEKFFLFACPLH